MAKKLTPKQRVLKKFPKAHAYRYAGVVPWVIYSGDPVIGSLNAADRTAAQGWAEAAKLVRKWARSKRRADREGNLRG